MISDLQEALAGMANQVAGHAQPKVFYVESAGSMDEAVIEAIRAFFRAQGIVCIVAQDDPSHLTLFLGQRQ